MDQRELEFGLDTFGDVTRDETGRLLSQAEVLRNVIAEGTLADEVGVDAFGVGEHHRPDFAISAPEVVLAGIASQTKRIKLGSAVAGRSSSHFRSSAIRSITTRSCSRKSWSCSRRSSSIIAQVSPSSGAER